MRRGEASRVFVVRAPADKLVFAGEPLDLAGAEPLPLVDLGEPFILGRPALTVRKPHRRRRRAPRGRGERSRRRGGDAPRRARGCGVNALASAERRTLAEWECEGVARSEGVLR